MIGHGSDKDGALKRNGGAQIVGFQRLGDPVVQPDAAVHGNVFKAHPAPAAHEIVPRAGDLPLALLLGVYLLGVVYHVGVRVAVKEPVRNVQTAHLRDAVTAIQKNVWKQPFALKVRFKRLPRLLLRYRKRNDLLRLHAALEAVGQDRGT